MLDNIRIRIKYPLIIVVFSLLAAVITGIVAYTITVKELRAAEERKLIALLQSRKVSLQSYLNLIREDLGFLATNHLTLSAVRDFTGAFEELGGGAMSTLQRHYVFGSPFAVGLRENLDDAQDGSAYSKVHARYHPWFRKFRRKHGYYDIFIFNTKGDLVYSVYKEQDFAANLLTGLWEDSGLGKAYRAALARPEVKHQAFVDFASYISFRTASAKPAAKNELSFDFSNQAASVKPKAENPSSFSFSYQPLYGDPASFIASPIVDDNGLLVGAIALQMPIDKINKIMQVTAGMGKTGETYLVGKDLLMRSDSRFFKKSTILKTTVDTVTVRKALQGKSGIEVTPDYRGIRVLSAYAPLDFMGSKFAILAEVDESEVMAPIFSMQTVMLIGGVIIGILVTIIGVYLALGLSTPITEMTSSVSRIANDDFDTIIPSLGRKDEIGDMASAVNVLKDYAAERQVLLHDLQNYRNRLASELDMAKETQGVLMPHPDQIDEVARGHNLIIASHYEPSSELGGDMWDVQSLNDHQIVVTLVDFSGHGVNAALNTFRLHSLLEAISIDPADPAACLSELNKTLSSLLHYGQFATTFMGIIDTDKDTLVYANAATPTPFLFEAGNDEPKLLSEGSPALGMLDQTIYENYTAPFKLGASLFLYSDAFTEAKNADGERLFEEGLSKLVQKCLTATTQDKFLNSLIAEFNRKVTLPLDDDLTAVWISRNI